MRVDPFPTQPGGVGLHDDRLSVGEEDDRGNGEDAVRDAPEPAVRRD
jgi:hypothetical protein